MKYFDGSTVSLGDIVHVPVPAGNSKARVVMIGDTQEHLAIDEGFLTWVKSEKLVKPNAVAIEWVDANPFLHDDPSYAPVGKYMFSPIDEFVKRIE